MATIVISASRPSVVITQQSQAVVGSVSQQIVQIATTGPQGPQGIPGASGAGYTHTQASPATVWTINHNLGYRPSVELITLGGVEFDADVQHPTVNQCVVTMNSPLAGYARLG